MTLRTILTGEDRSASKALRGVGDQTEKTGDQAQKASSRFKDLGKVAALGLAGGLVLAGKAAVDFTKRAIEDQQSAQKLATTLHNTTGATKEQQASVEAWITAQGKAFGVTDDDLRPALAKLATATGSVSKAQKVASLAMDISAGTGKNLSQVSTALQRAYQGNTAGLGRLGVATKDQAGKALSLHQITKQLSDTYKGDAAKSADTVAGKQKILGTELNELKETIGYKLLPIAEKLTSWMVDDALPAVSSLSAWFSDHLIPTIKSVASVFSGNTGQMSATVKKDFGSIRDTISSVVSIARSIWRHFGSFIVEYIGTTLKAAIQIIGGALKIIQGIFKVFSSLLRGDWKGVWQGIKEILSGSLQVLKGLLRGALGALKLLWKAGWVVLKAILGQVWDGIKALVKLEIQSVVGMIKGLPAAIRAIGPLMLQAGKFLIQQLFHGIVAAAQAGAGFATSLISAVKNAINSVLHLPLQVSFDKGPIHIHGTVIPALAKGGITNGPTLAMIGDNPGGREAVIPLSGPNARGLGGDVRITINGALDPVAVGKQVQQALLKVKRLNGGHELGIA
jgi:hypothetical protein